MLLVLETAGMDMEIIEDAGCYGIGLGSVEQAVAGYDGELVIEHGGGEFWAAAVIYGDVSMER